MSEYPKIETLYRRDEKFKVVEGDFRLPEFTMFSRWLVTEKIDGTNVRVEFDLTSPSVRYKGRTDNAQMSTLLLTHLQDTFPVETIASAFDEGATGVLYGEGYGPKIQNGGDYRDDISFRLFDVKVGKWWLNWSSVEDVAKKLGIETVPVLDTYAELDDILDYVRNASSQCAAEDSGRKAKPEGVVARTDPLLFDRGGNRVVWKLKAKDFPS